MSLNPASSTATPGPAVPSALSAGALALAHLEAPRAEAEALLAVVLKITRASLLAHPERRLNAAEWALWEQALARRASGVPLAYISGWRGFWSLDLQVGPGVLVPRPETELLVELALAHDFGTVPTPRILDLGTGSGAIALAVAKELSNAEVWAVDRSSTALAAARANAQQASLQAVHLRQSDWFSALTGERFHLVLANPPYLCAHDPALASDGLCEEPVEALVAGPTGLEAIARIIAMAPVHLHPGAALYLEHGATQAEAVRALLATAGFSAINTQRDLAGHDRVSGGVWPTSV